MKPTEMKKILEGFEKEQLIRLVLEFAKLRKDNMAWLETKLMPEELPKSVEHYKRKISSGFEPRINLTVARKAISDFKKASNDRESLIDLMIFYVEKGTEITLAYGDMYDQFYTSMESMYYNVLTPQRMGRYQPDRKIQAEAESTGDQDRWYGMGIS